MDLLSYVFVLCICAVPVVPVVVVVAVVEFSFRIVVCLRFLYANKYCNY